VQSEAQPVDLLFFVCASLESRKQSHRGHDIKKNHTLHPSLLADGSSSSSSSSEHVERVEVELALVSRNTNLLHGALTLFLYRRSVNAVGGDLLFGPICVCE